MPLASPVPERKSSGMTQDWPWQPLGDVGHPNPFFYHDFYDDFDYLDTTNKWTATAASGSIAAQAGIGGQILFTTNAAANAFATLQAKNIGFNFCWDNQTLTTSASSAAGSNVLTFASTSVNNSPFGQGAPIVPGMLVQSATTNAIPANTIVTGVTSTTVTLSNAIGSSEVANGATIYFGSTIKKTAFLARLLSSAMLTNVGWIVGMMNSLTAPFTASNITDGIYIQKTAGSTALTVYVVANSLVTSLVVPTSLYQLVNNEWFDVGFRINRKGQTDFFFGFNMVGYTTNASNTSNASLVSAGVIQNRTPNFSFQNTTYNPSGVSPNVTTQNIAPTVAVTTSTTTAGTMVVDFVGAFQER